MNGFLFCDGSQFSTRLDAIFFASFDDFLFFKVVILTTLKVWIIVTRLKIVRCLVCWDVCEECKVPSGAGMYVDNICVLNCQYAPPEIVPTFEILMQERIQMMYQNVNLLGSIDPCWWTIDFSSIILGFTKNISHNFHNNTSVIGFS